MVTHSNMKSSLVLWLVLALVLPVAGRAQSAAGTPPVTATVQVGKSVTLAVTVDGTPPFTFQWFKNGTPLPSPNGIAETFTYASV